MSLLGQLAQARAELDADQKDPWHSKVEAAVCGKDAISTAALLDAASACDHGHSASPRCRHAQPALHPDQVAAAHAGWPGRQHSHSWMGSPRPYNEIVPSDLHRGGAGFNQPGIIP